MVHSPDSSYAQKQSERKGRKRGSSVGDGTWKDELSAGSRRVMPSPRRKLMGDLQERNGGPVTPDVSSALELRNDDEGSHGSAFLCRQALQSELRRRTDELLTVQRQRDAATAERRAQSDHQCGQIRAIECELQSKLRRTRDELEVARKECDDAVAAKQLQLEQQCDQVYDIEMSLQVELQKVKRDLARAQQQRDAARQELDAQSSHQQEQVRQIEAELQAQLRQARHDLALARIERDRAVAEKHTQLEQQCDLVEEVEMGLRMELRRVTDELRSALGDREDAVMNVHLEQEHQREQIRLIEMELQGSIQLKNEQLKSAQRVQRHRATLQKCSQLELQCDHAVHMEMELQRDLQEVLEDLQGLQEERDCARSQGGPQLGADLEHHFEQVREIEGELVQSREKLSSLRKACSADLLRARLSFA